MFRQVPTARFSIPRQALGQALPTRPSIPRQALGQALGQALALPKPPAGHSWESLMALALAQAAKAVALGEVPVGAVLVSQQGDIVSQGHNQSCADHDPTAHAELVVMRQAGLHVQNYRLGGHVLVVTLEPCLMCVGAMVHARLEGVVYGARDAKAGAVSSCIDGFELPWLNHRPWTFGGVLQDQCSAILHDFFRTKAE